MKKKLLIFSSIGLLIIISAIVFLRISLSKPQPVPEVDQRPIEQDISPQDSGQISQAKAREAGQNVVRWLDGMKNESGLYYLNVECTDGLCSSPVNVDKQVGILAVWARFRNFLNNRQYESLDLIDKDLTTLTTPGVGFPAQNDLLNCQLMKEMHESEIFNQEQKNKIEMICKKGWYYGKEITEFERLYKFNQVFQEPSVEKVISGEVLIADGILRSTQFKKYALYGADLASLYQWSGEDIDLKAAKYFFDLALQIYSRKENNLQDSVIGISSVELFKATKEKKYDDFAEYFFKLKKQRGCLSLEDCAFYILFLENLKAINSEEVVKTEFYKIAGSIYGDSYDEKTGSFKNFSSSTYPLVSNSIISGIFANYE